MWETIIALSIVAMAACGVGYSLYRSVAKGDESGCNCTGCSGCGLTGANATNRTQTCCGGHARRDEKTN